MNELSIETGDITGCVIFGDASNTVLNTTITHHNYHGPKEEEVGPRISKEIIANKNIGNYLYKEIVKQSLEPEEVIKILRVVELEDQEIFEKVLISTLEDWQVLLHFNSTQVKYVLVSLVGLHKDLMSKLLLGKEQNFLHVLCGRLVEDPQVILSLIEWTKRSFDCSFLHQLMTAQTKSGNTILHLISRHQSPEVFWGIWQWLIEKLRNSVKDLLKLRNEDGENFLQINNFLIPLLKSVKQEFKDPKLFKKLVLGQRRDGENLCHLLVENSPQLFLEILEMMDAQVTKEIFMIPGASGVRVWEKIEDVSVLQRIILKVVQKHGKKYTKNLILHADEHGNSVLVALVHCHNFFHLLDWFVEEFQKEFTLELILKRNHEDLTFLDEVKLLNPPIFEEFTSWLTRNSYQNYKEGYIIFNNDTLDDYLKTWFDPLTNNDSGRKIVFALGKSRNDDELKEYLEVLLRYLDQKLVWELLFRNEITIFTYLRRVNKIPNKKIFEICFQNSHQEDLKDFLLSLHSSGKPFLLHLPVSNIPLLSFLDFLATKIGQDLLSEILLNFDDYNRTFLHIASMSLPEQLFLDLLFYLLKKFGRQFTTILILLKTKHKSSPLHLLSENNRDTSVNSFLIFLLDNFDKDFDKDS